MNETLIAITSAGAFLIGLFTGLILMYVFMLPPLEPETDIIRK